MSILQSRLVKLISRYKIPYDELELQDNNEVINKDVILTFSDEFIESYKEFLNKPHDTENPTRWQEKKH